MSQYIILGIIAAIIGGVIIYLILRPRLKAVRTLDEKINQQNSELEHKNWNLQQENENLWTTYHNLHSENAALTTKKNSILEQIDNLNSNMSAMEKQAQDAADLFYKTKMQVAHENLERALVLETEKFQESVKNFGVQYDEIVATLMEQYKELEGNVAIMRATNDAAVEAAKRADEMKNKQEFYRIQLSEEDVHEIELLRSVEPYLRDKEPLNKVIWKCYYEKPTTDLIGRVIGSGVKTGIYKITEIKTGKCYVGQAASLSDRWKQHIKRGVGADTPTRNKLYPAMIAAGPENFTFEVIEECDRALLDEREDFWQEYFKAREYGYSIK